MCQHFGIETDERFIPRIALGFGGGIGNTGSVCGAVAGAVMGMGLVVDCGETMEEALGALDAIGELRRRFEEEMGSILCRELTGVDLTMPHEVEEYMASDTPQTVCFPAVATAYRLTLELLER